MQVTRGFVVDEVLDVMVWRVVEVGGDVVETFELCDEDRIWDEDWTSVALDGTEKDVGQGLPGPPDCVITVVKEPTVQ